MEMNNDWEEIDGFNSPGEYRRYGKRYRSVISSRAAVTEIISHETAERHGAAAMGIPLGTS
jgi:hypothetical protein